MCASITEIGSYDVLLGPHTYKNVRFFTIDRNSKPGCVTVGLEFYSNNSRYIFNPGSILNIRSLETPVPRLNISLYTPVINNNTLEHGGILLTIYSPSEKLIQALKDTLNSATLDFPEVTAALPSQSFGVEKHISITEHLNSLKDPIEGLSPRALVSRVIPDRDVIVSDTSSDDDGVSDYIAKRSKSSFLNKLPTSPSLRGRMTTNDAGTVSTSNSKRKTPLQIPKKLTKTCQSSLNPSSDEPPKKIKPSKKSKASSFTAQQNSTTPTYANKKGKASTTRKNKRSSATTRPGVCANCGVTKTPMWRKGPDGYGTLCNACGVKYMLGKLKFPASN